MSNHEYALDELRRAASSACTVEVAEDALKKHEAFMATMASADERVEVVLADVEALADHVTPEKVQERAKRIADRRTKNRDEAQVVTALLQVA